MKAGISIVIALVLAPFLSAGEPVPFENVLFITIDTLRADYLSCYGSSKGKTPHIDSLAGSGVLFRNTITPIPVTLPSHASIFTGLNPPAHGVRSNGNFFQRGGLIDFKIENKIATLAEVFREAGFHTAAFVSGGSLDSRFGLDQGFDLYDDELNIFNPERNAVTVADAALKWLESAKPRWFLWVHFFDPHDPYVPPGVYRQTYANDLYAGEVAYTDQHVGRILSFLRKKNLQKKTLVVLTADHGEGLAEHGEDTHGMLAYEETLRVPFILSPFEPRVIETRVRTIDIAPTVLEVMHLSFPGKMEGESLVNLIQNGAAAPKDGYFEALASHLEFGWAPLRGFYSGNHKFIDLPIPELYDLSRDPGERKNLCSDEQLCSRWKDQFQAYLGPLAGETVSAPPVDPDTAEQLAALGYVSSRWTGPKKKEYGPEDDPKVLFPLYRRVRATFQGVRDGKFQESISALQKVIEEKPDFSMAYLALARIYRIQGFPERSVEMLKRAVANGISDSMVHGQLGTVLFDTKQYEESIHYLTKALKEDPTNESYRDRLTLAYRAIGKPEEAERVSRDKSSP